MSCCFLGYLYQGPPFRLGYYGIGEILCWLAFGPLAYSACLKSIRTNYFSVESIPWNEALMIGSGPALATSLVLFCSHFHQFEEDKKNGKRSPIVQLGTYKSSQLIPFFVLFIFLFQVIPVIQGNLSYLTLLCLFSLPWGFRLIEHSKKYHNDKVKMLVYKFLALKFFTINGFLYSIGLFLS